MTYKCLIVDDEYLARELIEINLSKLDDFIVVASCASAIEAHKVLQQQPIDLLFLDIEMPLLKGTDFYKNLQNKPKVIFTTAYRDYAIEGFNLNAVDYLLKPITFERFFQAIEKFLAAKSPEKSASNINKNPKDESFVYLKYNRKNIKIIFDEITYIESIKDYVKIHFSETNIVVKHGLTALEKKLDDRFVRVHRSYLVNRHKITAFTKKDVEIGRIEIPIGELYKEGIDRILSE